MEMEICFQKKPNLIGYVYSVDSINFGNTLYMTSTKPSTHLPRYRTATQSDTFFYFICMLFVLFFWCHGGTYRLYLSSVDGQLLDEFTSKYCCHLSGGLITRVTCSCIRSVVTTLLALESYELKWLYHSVSILVYTLGINFALSRSKYFTFPKFK